MANSADMFDRAPRKKDAKLNFVFRLAGYCPFNRLFPLGSVLRINALQPFFPIRRSQFRLEAVYAVPFFREMQGLPSRYLPDPASRMSESLRFRQISLA